MSQIYFNSWIIGFFEIDNPNLNIEGISTLFSPYNSFVRYEGFTYKVEIEYITEDFSILTLREQDFEFPER